MISSGHSKGNKSCIYMLHIFNICLLSFRTSVLRGIFSKTTRWYLESSPKATKRRPERPQMPMSWVLSVSPGDQLENMSVIFSESRHRQATSELASHLSASVFFSFLNAFSAVSVKPFLAWHCAGPATKLPSCMWTR